MTKVHLQYEAYVYSDRGYDKHRESMGGIQDSANDEHDSHYQSSRNVNHPSNKNANVTSTLQGPPHYEFTCDPYLAIIPLYDLPTII